MFFSSSTTGIYSIRGILLRRALEEFRLPPSLSVKLNMVFAITYLASVSAGNILIGLFFGLATVAAIIVNIVIAWKVWATNLRDGFGEYQFFL